MALKQAEILSGNGEGSHRDREGGQRLLVTFSLGEEEYGMEAAQVQEIVALSRITALPNLPDFVKGLVNLRGSVVPVMDLAARFGLPVRPYGPHTAVVVVRTGGRTMGVIVEAVNDVVELCDEEVQPLPDLPVRVDTRFIRGIGRKDDRFIILVDVNRVLSLDELEALAGLG